MYLSSQLFLKTPNKNLKLQEKPKKNAFFSDLRPKFQKFYLQCLPWGHPTEPLN